MDTSNTDGMGKSATKSPPLEPPRFDAEKFEQVLHYIIYKVGNQENVGKTVLFKLMYFCDFNYLEKYTEYLTGETYLKWNQGPAPIHFDAAIESLKNKKAITLKRRSFFSHWQKKFLSQKEPTTNRISKKETVLIDAVLRRLGKMKASEISSYSHKDIPWIATEGNRAIDYRLVFYRKSKEPL
jgi:uncharacterized phage-associated protein